MDMSLCQQGGCRTQRPGPFAADVTVERENKGAREPAGGRDGIIYHDRSTKYRGAPFALLTTSDWVPAHNSFPQAQ